MFIIRTVLFFVHLFVMALLLGTLLNAYLPPKWISQLNLLSLLFPFLLFLHFVLSVFWVVSFRKRAIFFVFSWVLLFEPIQRWVNYTPLNTQKPDLSVMTYNSKGLSEEKKRFFNAQSVDVLLLQEAGWGKRDKMKLSNFKHQIHAEIMGIYSKYPIINYNKILLSDNGYAFYADIKVKEKIVRFINIYLEPFQLDKTMLKPSISAEINEMKAKSLVSKLQPVFKIHQMQIDEIKKHIQNSPYPVILAGDFNAVPNSYEYYQFSENLKDAFVHVGRGSATSFHDYKFPIRIDYIFSSPSIEPLVYKVNREVKLSDHYPVYAEFYFKK